MSIIILTKMKVVQLFYPQITVFCWIAGNNVWWRSLYDKKETLRVFFPNPKCKIACSERWQCLFVAVGKKKGTGR
jgi:hypothetical protein